MTFKRAHGWPACAAVAVIGILVTAAVAGMAAPDDRVAAQALVEQIHRDAGHAFVTADALAHAEDALQRATRMHAAGDSVHANEAEALARQWAETAIDEIRAVDAEARANDLRKQALETEAQVAKTRELVEAVVARSGRLRAEIEALQLDAGPPHIAVEVHDPRRADAGRSDFSRSQALTADGGLP